MSPIFWTDDDDDALLRVDTDRRRPHPDAVRFVRGGLTLLVYILWLCVVVAMWVRFTS